MNVTTIGIDLAKNTFSLHGVDAVGKAVFKKTFNRRGPRGIRKRCAVSPRPVENIVGFQSFKGERK